MRKIKLILTTLIMVFASVGITTAQFDPEKFEESLKTASFTEKLEAANLLIEDQLYVYASRILVELCKEEPENANVNYKAGFCLLQISNERSKALPYLLNAESGITKKYNPFSPLVKDSPIETYYYLGRAYHLDEQLDKAIESFNKFIEEAGKKHILKASAEHAIKQCNYAKGQIANPDTELVVNNVGARINGEYEDYAPVVTPDESAMFFTSRRLRSDSVNQKIFSPQDGMHFEDVYVSYKDFKTNKWGEPEVLTLVSSPKSNQASISVSSDGQTLFVYKDINGDGQIWESEFNGDTYDTPEKLGSDINTPAWETHATLSADGQTLYFVSDRDGGLGGRDIYRCRKLPNGEWSLAQNIGAPINTPYDEDAPFLHPDGKTMYFGSNNESSIGGFDIFFTRIEIVDDKEVWAEPTNMGYPLNTTDDDIFFVTNASGERGYFSAIRNSDNFGQKDIYTVELDSSVIENFAILKGYIDPGKGKTLPDGILIYVTDLTEGGDPQLAKPNKKNGSYIFNLVPCHEYLAEYTLNDETFYETEFKVPCDASYNETDIVLNLDGVRLNGEPADTDPDSLPEGDKDKWKYQLLVGDNPYLKSGFVEFMDGELVAFKELLTEDGFFKYRELEGGVEAMKVIDIDDPTLCNALSLKLYDENNNLIRETKRDVRCKTSTVTYDPVEYQKFYGYNIKGIDPDEKRWETFIAGVKGLIEKRGYAKVEIEGSASYVPTRTFKKNTILSKKRTDDGEQELIKELKAAGIDADKVKIIARNSKVQGPKYAGDFKNTEKYGPYQYIKIKAF